MRKDERKKLDNMNSWELLHLLQDKKMDSFEILEKLKDNNHIYRTEVITTRIDAYLRLIEAESWLMLKAIEDMNLKLADAEQTNPNKESER